MELLSSCYFVPEFDCRVPVSPCTPHGSGDRDVTDLSLKTRKVFKALRQLQSTVSCCSILLLPVRPSHNGTTTQSAVPPGSVLVSGKSQLSKVIPSCHLCLPGTHMHPPFHLHHHLPPPSMNIFPAGSLQAHPCPTQLPHNPDLGSVPVGDQKFPKDFSLTKSKPKPSACCPRLEWPVLLSFQLHQPSSPSRTPSPAQPRRTPHGSSPGPICVIPPQLPRVTPLPSSPSAKAPGLRPRPAIYYCWYELRKLLHLSEPWCSLLEEENNPPPGCFVKGTQHNSTECFNITVGSKVTPRKICLPPIPTCEHHLCRRDGGKGLGPSSAWMRSGKWP